MKVVQILIDGFHPDYTQKELLDLDHVSQLYSGYVKIDSKFPRLKRLNSPYMWGRTLAGPEFPRTLEGYNPNHTNLQSANDQGYMSINPSDWIWNKLSKKGIKSFIFPYYLIEAIPIENILSDDCSSLATIYAREYSEKEYRLIRNDHDYRILAECAVYHAICDNFDYNYGMSKQEVASLRNAWMNYSGDTQSQFDEMIELVKSRMVPKVLQDLSTNDRIIQNEMLRELKAVLKPTDPGSYTFLGFVESDAIEHYALPYAEVFDKFRAMMNSVVDYLDAEIHPDILIIHGDHNMVRSDELQKPYKAEFDYDGVHYHTHKAGYNHFPMYTDHGNRVGGYVFYRDTNQKELVEKLLDTDDLVIDRLRSWILNEVFREESNNEVSN